MGIETILVQVVIVATALLSPFGLWFEGGDIGGARVGRIVRAAIFATLSVLMSTGFAGLAALAAGAVLQVDGLAAMAASVWLWAPCVIAGTALALVRTRRPFGRG